MPSLYRSWAARPSIAWTELDDQFSPDQAVVLRKSLHQARICVEIMTGRSRPNYFLRWPSGAQHYCFRERVILPPEQSFRLHGISSPTRQFVVIEKTQRSTQIRRTKRPTRVPGLLIDKQVATSRPYPGIQNLN